MMRDGFVVTTHAMVRRLTLLAVLTLAVPWSAFGWGFGSNTVQSPAEDGAAATGYGPGWMLLSYMPNCPGVGYVLSEGMLGKPSPDHVRVNDTRDRSYGYSDQPPIERWPWGFAHGAYDGCAFTYGTSKLALEGAAPSLCPSAPQPPADRCATSAFCTNEGADPYCSPRGVWGSRDGEPNGKDAYALGCAVYANIGHRGVFAGNASPTQALGQVPAGARLDVRYVTRDRKWAWAKWNDHPFVNGVVWGFFPRSCISPTPPPPPPADPCAGMSCDDGNGCTTDACSAGQCSHVFRGECLGAIVALFTEAICGDGTVDPDEDCDDGNAHGGDCCAATCRFEAEGTQCGVGCDPRQCDAAGRCVTP